MVLEDLDDNKQLGPFYLMKDLGPEIAVVF